MVFLSLAGGKVALGNSKKGVGMNQKEISSLIEEWKTILGQIDQIERKLKLSESDPRECGRLRALRATRFHEAATLVHTIESLASCMSEGGKNGKKG